jgi:hypothetical protein
MEVVSQHGGPDLRCGIASSLQGTTINKGSAAIKRDPDESHHRHEANRDKNDGLA